MAFILWVIQIFGCFDYYFNNQIQMQLPTRESIIQAHDRIKPYINITPLLASEAINNITGCQIQFKCENFQKTGSFKIRGAANKILSLKNPSILCTYSSGNHAQAVACVSKSLQIKSVIVIPFDTPQVKKEAIKSYGAQIVQGGATAKDLIEMSTKIKNQRNAQFIHAHNDLKIIAGSATIFYQAIRQSTKKFDFIVFPVGGGGLASGTLLSTLYFSPQTIPIGVQPQLAKDTYLSLKQGKIHPQLPPITLAQGVRTGIGDITFQIMQRFLKDVILVSQQQMINASKLFQERMKIVVELSAAIVLAAIIKDPRFRKKNVCAIISGGNIDLSQFFDDVKAKL